LQCDIINRQNNDILSVTAQTGHNNNIRSYTTMTKESACMLYSVSTNFAKRWIGNVNLMQYCDVANSAYPVTMTTICHY